MYLFTHTDAMLRHFDWYADNAQMTAGAGGQSKIDFVHVSYMS